MNLIWIIADTCRADYLSCYGAEGCKTPNLDALAADAVRFDEAYVEGLPTGPERIIWLTGKFTLPFRGWVPLDENDITIARVLGERGYVSMNITDAVPLTRPKANYHADFTGYLRIRGQEADPYITASVGRSLDEVLRADSHKIPPERKQRGAGYREALAQYLRNTGYRVKHSDYFVAQACQAAMDWLDENARAHENFFLWLDCFDPHEPWDAPPEYIAEYADADYKGANLIAPWFHSLLASDFTEEELKYIRALYAAEVAFVDHWIGQVLDKAESLGLFEDTLILFTSDHGTLLGERNHLTKCPRYGNTCNRALTRIPLIIRHPDGPHGKVVSEYVWSPDLMPTVLDILGVEAPENSHGRPYWPLVSGDTSLAREHVICGWHGAKYYYVRDKQYAYTIDSKEGKEELYDIATDPVEANDISRREPEATRAMKRKLDEFFEEAESLP